MTVVNWELGHSTPQIAHLRQIVEFLGYNPFPEGTTIASRLVNFRKARGISQRQFAQQLGIDQGTLARYERDERIPTGKYLSMIAGFFE